MAKFSRRTKIIAAFVIVVAVGYAIALYWKGQSQIPQDFTNARAQGAIIAQSIVDISNQSVADLQKVNQYDAQGDYSDALKLTADLVSQSSDLRNKAVDLSAQIGEMTKALSSIQNFDARQAALESISSRLAVVNQLITYSGDLAHLEEILQNHFNGNVQAAGEVQGAVNQINTDVNAINNFNAQATQAMSRFDRIIGN